MELFDELNDNGEYTGRTVTREDAHNNGLRHRGVILFIVNSKNQVLMQQRSATKRQWPNCWDGAGGGHVDAGELGMFAAIRELYEELGIKVKPSEVRYIGAYLSEQKTDKVWNKHFNEFYVAHKNVNPKKIKIQESEVQQIQWIDFPRFKEWTRSRSPELTEKYVAFDALIHYIEKYVLN